MGMSFGLWAISYWWIGQWYRCRNTQGDCSCVNNTDGSSQTSNNTFPKCWPRISAKEDLLNINNQWDYEVCNTGHTYVDPDSKTGSTVIVKLDTLNLQKVDYIKIDCEGFEYRVLQGAKDTIQRCRPVVVIEQKPHDMYSKDYGQFAAICLLEDWGMVRLDQVKDDWIMGWR